MLEWIIFSCVGLNHPVLCVEPSVEMMHFAEKRDGLIPFLGTADEFLANDDPKLKHYSKILINGSAHCGILTHIINYACNDIIMCVP